MHHRRRGRVGSHEVVQSGDGAGGAGCREWQPLSAAPAAVVAAKPLCVGSVSEPQHRCPQGPGLRRCPAARGSDTQAEDGPHHILEALLRGRSAGCKLVVGIAIGVVERAIGLGLLRGPDRRIARKSVVVVPIWHACGGWVRGGPCWRFVSVKEAIYVGELDQLLLESSVAQNEGALGAHAAHCPHHGPPPTDHEVGQADHRGPVDTLITMDQHPASGLTAML
mmetsp:Transcript_41361/g.69636  ORF Transcript_41361/g.69636 Transcript_41361/m.69636 type:complete len:223 (-) Transcript_41361:529-1197(-)